MKTLETATKTNGKKEATNRVAGLMNEENVVIKPLNHRTALFRVVGTAPLMVHAFGAKAINMMRETQQAGQQAKSRRNRTPKNFDEAFKEACYVSTENWYGIPAASFRSSMISACRLIGFKMTWAKQSIFIVADGIDKATSYPLVRINGTPIPMDLPVRNQTGVADIRRRPVWNEWSIDLKVLFDADIFSLTDVANLLSRAGVQVGVGECRPDSRNSNGLGFGTWRLEVKDGNK